MIVRRFAEALRKLDQVLNITPDDLDTLVEKAAIAQAEGRGLTGRGLTEKLCVQTAKFRGISMKAKGRKIVDSPALCRFTHRSRYEFVAQVFGSRIPCVGFDGQLLTPHIPQRIDRLRIGRSGG